MLPTWELDEDQKMEYCWKLHGVHYLWVADELPVQLCIKRLHMSTVHVQDGITNNTDLGD